ncbi:hypothetical protein QOZ80_9AG0693160 [Eleusine coracana subsp. coracana]|nr:hypothetical protein QOZ80_9AG0693160 [Eleusine coracana subsp. coracana]
MTSLVQPITMRNFCEKLDTDKLVVLEFTAPSSEPCKFMKPKLERLAHEKQDKTVFYALDIKEFKGLAEWLDVEALPTFALVHKFCLKGRVIGVDEAELRRAIDSAN